MHTHSSAEAPSRQPAQAPTPLQLKDYLSSTDIAQALGISLTTFKCRVRDDLPPPMPIGACKRWHKDDLRRLLEKRRGVSWEPSGGAK